MKNDIEMIVPTQNQQRFILLIDNKLYGYSYHGNKTFTHLNYGLDPVY